MKGTHTDSLHREDRKKRPVGDKAHADEVSITADTIENKPRVCLIGPLPPPMTGLSKALDSILRSPVCQQNFNFSVIDLSKIYTVSGGTLSIGKVTGLSKLVRQVRNMAENEGIDVFYLTNAQSTVGAVRDLFILHTLGRFKDGKKYSIVVHLHGGSFHNLYLHSSSVLKALLRKNYAYVDRAVVLGSSLRNMFEELVPDDRISVIPNCVDDEVLIDEYAFSDKLSRMETKRNIQVLYLSNMIPAKGYRDVLKAAELCMDNLSDVSFVFAGAFYLEKEKDDFLTAVAELNARYAPCADKDDLSSDSQLESSGRERICYLGPVSGENKKQLLQDSDIFVLPTYYPHEGQPITIIEAMSAGMPVICTDHAGIKDLVSEPDNCCFVPARSPESIAEKLSLLVGNRALMKRMALSNRNKVLQHYREQNYIGRIVSLLNENLPTR